jgi:RNA polymerase sigma-70 factor, ECF subfamily
MRPSTLSAGEVDSLVARVQDGDQDAFTHLVDEVMDDVRIFVSSRTHAFDLVDEVVQAAFVSAYESIRKYRLQGTFVSWLKGIARNLLLRELHDRARFHSVEGDALESALAQGAAETLAAQTSYDDREALSDLEGCLGELSSRARQILQRHHADGVPMSRLAQQFKQTESAIASALKRIRQQVRACMESGSEPA